MCFPWVSNCHFVCLNALVSLDSFSLFSFACVHVDIFDILYPSPATHYSRGGEWYFFPHISYSNTAFNFIWF